jgi:hypothetical protein
MGDAKNSLSGNKHIAVCLHVALKGICETFA